MLGVLFSPSRNFSYFLFRPLILLLIFFLLFLSPESLDASFCWQSSFFSEDEFEEFSENEESRAKDDHIDDDEFFEEQNKKAAISNKELKRSLKEALGNEMFSDAYKFVKVCFVQWKKYWTFSYFFIFVNI